MDAFTFGIQDNEADGQTANGDTEFRAYGVSYAEDILFVTVKVRNESGDWCAEDENGIPVLDSNGNQICGEGMIMPDGTKLNDVRFYETTEVKDSSGRLILPKGKIVDQNFKIH